LHTKESFGVDGTLHNVISGLEVYQAFEECWNSESCTGSKQQFHMQSRRKILSHRVTHSCVPSDYSSNVCLFLDRVPPR
jgi:hypothetical protein